MTVVTTLTPDPVRFPLSGIAELDRNRTPVPDAELIFRLEGEAISDGDATGQRINVNMNLPVGYAYYIVEVACEVINATAVNFEDCARMACSNTTAAGASERFAYANLDGKTVAAGAASGPTKTYTIDRMKLPTTLLPANNAAAGGRVGIKVSNTNASETGYTFNLFARVLEFEISQAYNYAVNTATLIR